MFLLNYTVKYAVFAVNIRAKYSMGTEFLKVNPDFIV